MKVKQSYLIVTGPCWDHSFSTYTKFSAKLIFLTLVCVSEGRKC